MIFDDLSSKTMPFTGENFRSDILPEGIMLVNQSIAEDVSFYRIDLGEKGIPFVINRFETI